MKYFIKRNPMAKHGYEFLVESDDGSTIVVPMNKKTGDGYIFVPTEYVEALNRKLVKFSDFEGVDLYEVTRREGVSRAASHVQPSQPKQSLMELGNLLADAKDKAKWQELVKKIEHAKLIAKAQAEYERSKAAYEALLNGGNK
jgi:hypothetical protein